MGVNRKGLIGIVALGMVLLLVGSGWSAPRLVQYQGRLEDGSGPVTGLVDLEFIFSSDADGLATLWSEMHLDVPVENGIFSVSIGSVEVSGVPVELFPPEGAWLEVVVNGEALSPRQQLASSLYALQALYAENATFAFTADTVDGLDSADLDQRAHLADTANPHQVTATDVGAVSAADLAGHTGNAAAHHAKTTSFADLADQAADSQLPASIARDSELTWTNLTGVPAGFADGVDDTATLSEAQVENYVTNGALDLFPGSSMGGLPLATGAHTTSLDWGSLTNVPAGFADGVDANSQLSEGEVENYVTNGPLNLDAGTLLGGVSITTGPHTTELDWNAVQNKPAGFADGVDNDAVGGLVCAAGQVAKWNGAAWACADDDAGVGGGTSYGGVAVVAKSGGDYSDPRVALADIATWCGVPSETNRCLLKIMPGAYDIGNNPTGIVNDYVSIVGSGIESTLIVGNYSSSVSFVGLVNINYASNASISEITIMNKGNGVGYKSIALAIWNSSNISLSRVKLVASGNRTINYSTYGLFINTMVSNVSLFDSYVQVYGGNGNRGIDSGTDTSGLRIARVRISMDSGENVLASCESLVSRSNTDIVDAELISQCTRENYGIVSTAGGVKARGVFIAASGGTGNYGMYSDGGSIELNFGVVTASTNTVWNNSSNVIKIGNSKLEASTTNNSSSGQIICAGIVDDNFNFYQSSCP
ncbi:MAG: hypothetical protein P1P84_16430 [Deferrisomatales bacterium]|nr:hypothetical protein [Deferrisomatales bacterium]